MKAHRAGTPASPDGSVLAKLARSRVKPAEHGEAFVHGHQANVKENDFVVTRHSP